MLLLEHKPAPQYRIKLFTDYGKPPLFVSPLIMSLHLLGVPKEVVDKELERLSKEYILF